MSDQWDDSFLKKLREQQRELARIFEPSMRIQAQLIVSQVRTLAPFREMTQRIHDSHQAIVGPALEAARRLDFEPFRKQQRYITEQFKQMSDAFGAASAHAASL